MQRILICGDRNWKNFQLILETLLEEHKREPVETVIHGAAQGADTLGGYAAERLGIPVLSFPADWRKYGRNAGPVRNRTQLKEGRPTLGLAFHDFLENSKGTKDMVKLLWNAGIPVHIISSRGEKK
jgi:hypothetical protein